MDTTSDNMDLFDLPDPPAHHSHDPESSRIALDSHEESGHRTRNQGIVYSLVRSNPGYTACELWEAATDDQRVTLKELQEVRRRISDLQAKGMVQPGKSRRCRVRGSTQTTWNIYRAGV